MRYQAALRPDRSDPAPPKGPAGSRRCAPYADRPGDASAPRRSPAPADLLRAPPLDGSAPHHIYRSAHPRRPTHNIRPIRPMFSSPAYAQAAGSASSGGGTAAFMVQIAPLILIFIVFWFLLIRPQQKRMKEQQAAIAAVKKGDSVTTAGGIVGKVTRVEDDHVEVEIAPGTKVRVVKMTLSAVHPLGGAKPAND
ncbi:preprotein translocase subunit YajC [Sphingomonas gilva]|uniref:Sec translocon accessory complex subunit YajC n=2 Tax=Sphingomonas gilva TaxID=2305907 RepID=A0A396RT51_9SPHN|nr:preprotein translocase subunit YajC [Sphingomonas gilva]